MMDFRLLVIASTLSCVFAQAPGDSASLCVDKLYNNGTAVVPNPFFGLHPVYRSNVRPLMDSRDYVNLLDTPNPVWQQVDNDTSNAADTVTSWIQQTGSPCQQTVLVCGFDKGPQSNWLIFQHISRQLTDGKLLDYVTAQFDFQLNGCDESRQCRQSFDVYRWATSTPGLAAARNIDNYQLVQRVNPGDTSGTVRMNVSVTIDLRSNTETGVYIAAVDLSTCVIIHRVLVFYYVCPADSSNLITRPETVAPLNGVPGECAENSSVSGLVGKPLASCTATGTWDIISGCECNPGFQGVSQNMIVTSCSECPVGTFSDSVSNSVCQSCPANSEATQPGLTKCPCVQTYYRVPDEGAGENCTQPPSAPRNVSVLSVTNTSAVLSWLPPVDNGGRNRSEIFYTVNADGSGASVTVVVTVNVTMSEVTGLTPFSQYTFYVISENAVSSQARDTGGRSSSTSATTPEGAAGKVSDIPAPRDSMVSWAPPNPPQGIILYYNIRITQSDTGELVRLILKLNRTSFDVSSEVMSAGAYRVEVQAVTQLGPGSFSAPVNVTVGGDSTSSDNTKAVVAGVTAAIIVVICVLATIAILLVTYIIWYRRHVRAKQMYNDVIELPKTGNRMYVDPTTYSHVDQAVQEFAFEIPLKDIRLTDEIGAGEFGTVYKGIWKKSKQQLPIAVKTLKPGSSSKVRGDFLTEASIMGQFNHHNVIKLHGVVTRVEPVMIVMEFMEKGSLYNYLRKNDEMFSSELLVRMALGVARGMDYLSTIGYVHRDLAARNILLDKDDTPKVADFGLSRETEDDDNYTVNKGGKIPVRWTAPEAIAYRRFTFSSDVWSFGVLLWEVMSYCQQPYEEWDNQTVLDKVEAGHRLHKPKDCPDTVYTCMLECWNADHKKRPTFKQVVRILEILLDGSVSDGPLPKPRPAKKPQTTQRQLPSPLQFNSVSDWLNAIKMSKYAANFERSNFNSLQECMSLTADDLIQMGITLAGHQNKIISSMRVGREELDRQPSIRI